MDLRRSMLFGHREVTPYSASIQDTTGKLWTAEKWDGTATPNGIAVRDKSYGPPDGILISIPQSTPSKVRFASSSSYSIEGKGILDATKDYGGAQNTKTIAQIIPNSPAITACTGYTFPNGQKGYLGAFGEILLITRLRNEIDECLLALGGSSLLSVMSDYIWSSTVSNYSTTQLYVWSSTPAQGGAGVNGNQATATNSRYVWPIGKIDY